MSEWKIVTKGDRKRIAKGRRAKESNRPCNEKIQNSNNNNNNVLLTTTRNNNNAKKDVASEESFTEEEICHVWKNIETCMMVIQNTNFYQTMLKQLQLQSIMENEEDDEHVPTGGARKNDESNGNLTNDQYDSENRAINENDGNNNQNEVKLDDVVHNDTISFTSTSKTMIQDIVCYGVGNFSQVRSAAMWQLACLLCLRNHLFRLTRRYCKIRTACNGNGDCNNSSKSTNMMIHYFDPQTSPLEHEVLRYINLKNITKNNDTNTPTTTTSGTLSNSNDGILHVSHVNECGCRSVSRPTLFFMPHCPQVLYHNVLTSNWNVQQLNCVIIIGNSLSAYHDATVMTSSTALNQHSSDNNNNKRQMQSCIEFLLPYLDEHIVTCSKDDLRSEYTLETAFNDFYLVRVKVSKMQSSYPFSLPLSKFLPSLSSKINDHDDNSGNVPRPILDDVVEVL